MGSPTPPEDQRNLQQLSDALCIQFHNNHLLETALTHRSYVFETDEQCDYNERLEFLGDSVLKLVVSEYLLDCYPTFDEGQLSKKRAILISDAFLSHLAGGFKLYRYIRTGPNALKHHTHQAESTLSATFEAIIAAIYLDLGIHEVKQLIIRCLSPYIQDTTRLNPFIDFKTLLQEETQRINHQLPVYTITRKTGPDHKKTFKVSCEFTHGDKTFKSRGSGSTRKSAEQQAAQKLLDIIQNSII